IPFASASASSAFHLSSKHVQPLGTCTHPTPNDRVAINFLVPRKVVRISGSMRLEFTLAAPLDQDDDGTIRLRGSRVTLETLVGAFKRGDSPEEIQEGFPG